MIRANSFTDAELNEASKHIVYLQPGEMPDAAIARWERRNGRRGCIVVG